MSNSFNKEANFWSGLRTQRRVMSALLTREILTRYGRHNIGFLWLFIEPMIFTLGVTALWTATKSVHGSDLPIVAFAITGYSSVLLWRNMPGRCINALNANLSLMYHKNIKVIDIYTTRIALEFFGATISFVSLSMIFIFIGWLSPPQDMLKILLGWLVLAWFGSALALYLGALSYKHELVEKLWHPASYLIFPLSGAAFMVDALPVGAQKYVLYIPMVHGVEIVRQGYFGVGARAHYDLSYVLPLCLILSLVALAQVRHVARSVVPE